MVSKYESCKWRLRAEKKPDSIISKIWRWHTTWCPGWKRYQQELSKSKKGIERERGQSLYIETRRGHTPKGDIEKNTFVPDRRSTG